MGRNRFTDDDLDKFPPNIREQIVEKTGAKSTGRTMQRHEQALQIACVEWADMSGFPLALAETNRWLLPPVKIGEFLHHTPNGGARSKAEGGVFKAMGVRAGYPDLSLDICMVDGKDTWPGFRCELKADAGKVAPNQQLRLETLKRAGYFCCVAWSLGEFQNHVFSYLGFGRPLYRGVWDG